MKGTGSTENGESRAGSGPYPINDGSGTVLLGDGGSPELGRGRGPASQTLFQEGSRLGAPPQLRVTDSHSGGFHQPAKEPGPTSLKGRPRSVWRSESDSIHRETDSRRSAETS